MTPNPQLSFVARLQRLDLLIEREILRLRGRYQLSLDEFRGLYVSDEHVDQLLNRSLPDTGDGDYLERVAQQAAALGEAIAGGHDPLQRLSGLFGLNEVEREVLFLALAPELDLKYETLYAYLNDDITKKWPTIQLAQRLLDERAISENAVRLALTPSAVLRMEGLVTVGDRGTSLRSAGHQGFALNSSVAQFLLGLPPDSAQMSGFTLRNDSVRAWPAIPASQALLHSLTRLPSVLAQPDPPLVVFAGEAGSGTAETAQALAGAMQLPLVELDLAALPRNDDAAALFDALALELKLWPALLRMTGLDRLVDGEGRPIPLAQALSRWLHHWHGPVVLDVPPGFPWRRVSLHRRGLQFDFSGGSHRQRAELWRKLLIQRGISLSANESALLADRFDFTAGRIESTLADAADLAYLQANTDVAVPQLSHILQSARAASDQHLGNLASKVRRKQGWDDLVLTPTTLARVREFAAAVRQRHVVFAEWGFAERLGHSGSLVALFAGASGTGKTMTAAVIAAELDIDLYKVDLSGLVSKYIGETEKNLERVFDVARKANAMLFFDEADALFGKRSEVKDAHDRYANIETAYLLQKLEEHPGVVILATNIKRNIDAAFARRLQYIVEFPVPDVRERERLWHGMFPAAAPLHDDIDFGFLARQFQLSGGSIRNVALDAAFLAAQADAVIDMGRIIQALARQYAKQGKIPSPSEFGPYHAMLSAGTRVTA